VAGPHFHWPRPAIEYTRKYHDKTVHGSMRDAQLYLSRKLQERQIGQLPQAAAMFGSIEARLEFQLLKKSKAIKG
jgi:hypothetical protein